MADKELVSAEDMKAVAEARTKVQELLHQAEKASAEVKIADLEFRCLVQNIFIKYSMKANDRIDDKTGEILRASDEAPADDAPADDAPVVEVKDTNDQA